MEVFFLNLNKILGVFFINADLLDVNITLINNEISYC